MTIQNINSPILYFPDRKEPSSEFNKVDNKFSDLGTAKVVRNKPYSDDI
jgi:hypothetical protein